MVCSKVYGTKYLDRSGVTFINLEAAYSANPVNIGDIQTSKFVLRQNQRIQAKDKRIISKPGEIVIN